jgi:ABC-type branched-subunit amino acid transport system permease subunit
LDASLLTLLVVQAFGAAAVGAFTSLVWTYAGGLLIGVGGSLATKYLAQHAALRGLPANLPFLVLFVGLLATPRRLLAEQRTPQRRTERPPWQPSSGVRITALTIGAALLLVAPRIAGTRLSTYTSGLTFVILFVSLGLLVRTSGQVSLCHMAFAAVGASTFAHALHAGLAWPLALLAGGLMAVPIGAIVAIPAIRLAGVYLAVATFGFGILLERIFYGTFLMFGAANSLKVHRPAIAGLHLDTDTRYYYVVLAAAVLCCGVVVIVRRSRLGRLLRALADSPASLTAHGVNTNLTRLFVFCISAFLAGIAGALAGPITGSASALSFDFSVSLVLLAVLAIAGRQPVVSAFIAATLYAVAPAYLTTTKANTYAQLVFGVLAVGAAIAAGRRVPAPRSSRRTAERASVSRHATRQSAAAPQPETA